LNLLSTVGYYGNVVTSITEKLLQKEMYDFVGSDVHHENHVNAFSNKILLKNHSDLSLPLSQNSFFKV
jgi:tyrosine-protein phosphatase YwqE